MSEIDLVALFCGVALSAACTVKVDPTTAVVGVPLSTPAVDNVKPPGSVPAVTAQVTVPVPPMAVNVRGEYGNATAPFGRGDAVVIERLTVSENALDAVCGVGVALSVTCTVKLNVPAVVGVPLMTPAADNVRPAGKVLPDARDHV